MDNGNRNGLLNHELCILEKTINNIRKYYTDCEDEMLNELFYSNLCKMKENCRNLQFVLDNYPPKN